MVSPILASVILKDKSIQSNDLLVSISGILVVTHVPSISKYLATKIISLNLT